VDSFKNLSRRSSMRNVIKNQMKIGQKIRLQEAKDVEKRSEIGKALYEWFENRWDTKYVHMNGPFGGVADDVAKLLNILREDCWGSCKPDNRTEEFKKALKQIK
jgi:hypothetical protein